MTDRIKPLLGALVAGYIVFFVAATYLYQPVAAPPAMDPLVPNWLSLAIGLVLLVLFFDWMNQAVGNPMKSGIIIAVSQILLVDCLYVLNGTRGIAAAGASASLLLVGWGVAGMVYGKLSDGQGTE